MVKANTVNPVKTEAPEAVPARLAVRDGVLAVVGDTPLVELTRVYRGFGGDLYAKLEALWPNQYANLHNPGSHHRTTMAEIAAALDGKVDFVFCATSTCGTVRGCGEYARANGLATRVVGVDAVGSLIFSDLKGPRFL